MEVYVAVDLIMDVVQFEDRDATDFVKVRGTSITITIKHYNPLKRDPKKNLNKALVQRSGMARVLLLFN